MRIDFDIDDLYWQKSVVPEFPQNEFDVGFDDLVSVEIWNNVYGITDILWPIFDEIKTVIFRNMIDNGAGIV